jgi:hypothetical protein
MAAARSFVEAGDTPACSTATIADIYAGVRPKELALTKRFIEKLEHYEAHSRLARYAAC